MCRHLRDGERERIGRERRKQPNQLCDCWNWKLDFIQTLRLSYICT